MFVLAVPEVPYPWDLHLGLSVEGRPGLIFVEFDSGSSSLTADLLLPIPLVLLAPSTENPAAVVLAESLEVVEGL